MVLVTAYRCHLLNADELRKLFPEINDWYIKKYLHDYSHGLYCYVARILNGKSMQKTLRFQKWNEFHQRIINRLKKYYKQLLYYGKFISFYCRSSIQC